MSSFSRTISESLADEEIRRYLKFREESEKKKAYDSLEPLAKKYYTSDEVSFIFTKSELDKLLQGTDEVAGDGPKANAFRIYYGATDTGVPTLVVVACSINTSKTYQGKDDFPVPEHTVNNLLKSSAEAAEQYPTKESPNGNSSTFRIRYDDVPVIPADL